ncbi:MAG: helix-turn-helix domain-containing protein [Chitinophagaceae bacterium]
MSEIFLKGITVSDLLEKIGQIVDHKIGSMQRLSIEKQAKPYLTRREVAQMLDISLPTLNDWSKSGLLRSYKIGNRVLYRMNEIEEAITQGAFKKGRRNFA